MGNILTVSSEQYDEAQNNTQLKIVLDMAAPVQPELKQLLFWSLG